ncbi:MAG: hypothetical protein PHV93_01030 [Candidatus Pacebacteria bacterium]|nr:hypothetical protein [Candidatus Paceibacterota bacterium]
MTPQAYLQQIKASSLSESTKKAIEKLLSAPDTATTAKIQELIQADIDESFKADDPAKMDDPEVMKVFADTDVELKKVEGDLESGLEFISKEMEKLEADVAQLDKIADANKLSQVRASL